MHDEFELRIKKNLVRTKAILVDVEKVVVLFSAYLYIVNVLFLSILYIDYFNSLLKQIILSYQQ